MSRVKEIEAGLEQWEALRPRERQAAILVAQGYDRHDGAEDMEVATKTFDHHRLEALNKLELGNAVQLLWFCLDNAIINANGDLIYEVEID